MKTKYNKKIVERMSGLPLLRLGQLVTTHDGNGIIVELKMEWNGLYINEETASATIWYSTAEAQNGWVSRQYKLSEIKASFTYLGYLSKEAIVFFGDKIKSEERDGCATVGTFIELGNGTTCMPAKGDVFTKDEKGIVTKL